MKKEKRLAWGVSMALSVHIGIAALLSGLVFILPKPTTAKIIEVNIVDLQDTWSSKKGSSDAGTALARSSKDRAAGASAVKSNPASANNETASYGAAPQVANSENPTDGVAANVPTNAGTAGNRANGNDIPSQAGNSHSGGADSGTGISSDGSTNAAGPGGDPSGKGSSNATDSGSAGPGEGSGPAQRPGEGEIANNPRLISGGKNYPAAARSANQQGTVLVHVTINVAGKVVNASLAASSGYPLLDNAAVNAAYGWSFSPATDPYGTPLSYTGNIPVEYDLKY